MGNKLIYSVREVFTEYIKGEERYVIPPYQRGYKWGETAIRQLLNDVDDFRCFDDADKFYCLQNITIVRRARTSEDSSDFVTGYNVVDGQQRLTTSLVLLSVLLDNEKLKQFLGKLRYDIRDTTHDFLQNYLLGKKELPGTWQDFVNSTPSSGESYPDYDHQDIYYLFNARKTVEKWLQERGDKFDSEQFALKFLDRVKFIVNLPNTVNENDLFSNLNGNKVNLDGADLLRAMIITRVPKDYSDTISDELKRVVLLNEQRVRIGMELDRINQWWQDEQRQKYFTSLTKSLKIDTSLNIDFDDKLYPIDLLYKLFILTKGKSEDKMSLLWFEDYFRNKGLEDNADVVEFYDELLELQRVVEDFYEDKSIYHLLMYTHTYGQSMKWRTYYDEWTKSPSRSAFIEWLKDHVWKIVSSYDLEPSSEHESSDKKTGKRNKIKLMDPEKDRDFLMAEDFYENGHLPGVCVLLDIIDILSSDSFPKLKAEYFKVKSEDKEHIFPQTPMESYKSTKHELQVEKMKIYIEGVVDYLKDVGIVIDTNQVKAWDEKKWNEMKDTINEAMKRIIPVGSLGNMCLLNSTTNRGYGNDFFTAKRYDIIRKSRTGTFIRPHVLDAFDKLFASETKREEFEYMSEWTIEDIFVRRNAIIKQINDFLK